MITYPNAKINIGLNVVARRTDGYHDLQTVFYPIPICDRLEILPSDSFLFEQDGITVDCPAEDNLIVKVLRRFQQHYHFGNVSIRFSKCIPFGAGLGGGSSDAAHTAIMLNQIFILNLTKEQLKQEVASLGADCAFFIENTPCYAEGIGERLTPINLSLPNYRLALVKPNVAVSTRDAYQSIVPQMPKTNLRELVRLPLTEWRDKVINDFETTVFRKYPQIQAVKDKLYDMGAIYSSMSGSGATVYAFFNKTENDTLAHDLQDSFPDYFTYFS